MQDVWSGPAAVVLNPGWGEGVPKEFEAVVRSFEVAYSFLPINIKVRGVPRPDNITPPKLAELQGWLGLMNSQRRPLPSRLGWTISMQLPNKKHTATLRHAQGLVGGQEGAVLRRGGGKGAAPWQILAMQRDGRFLQVRSWGAHAIAAAFILEQLQTRAPAAAVDAAGDSRGSACCSLHNTHYRRHALT